MNFTEIVDCKKVDLTIYRLTRKFNEHQGDVVFLNLDENYQELSSHSLLKRRKKVKTIFFRLSNFRNGHPIISMKSKYFFYDIIVLYLEVNVLK